MKEKQEEDERGLSVESRGVALVSRHAMEVEASTQHAGAVESGHDSEDLSHLVLQSEYSLICVHTTNCNSVDTIQFVAQQEFVEPWLSDVYSVLLLFGNLLCT